MNSKTISGFSKKTKKEKIDWLVSAFLNQDEGHKKTLQQYWNTDASLQKLHDDFIENTLTNFYLPFGIAPNFIINGTTYVIPMVIEESSVVAAASNAAKFWMSRGGFKAEVISTQKNGQIHLSYKGDTETLRSFFESVKPKLVEGISDLQANMKKRGGGLLSLELWDNSEALDDYFLIHASFETKDAMGANFINSCLEEIAKLWEAQADTYTPFSESDEYPEVVMSILSNYVPECLVRAEVRCSIDDLDNNGIEGRTFAENFVKAVAMAEAEPRRAVTHNKGIMNGVDAVVLATGNDFRAVEAGVHAYAARNGRYTSLTHAEIQGDEFCFSIELPLALGTVGGLSSLHPLVKVSMALLQQPTAQELMKIVAVAGLAQNFAAIRSLTTTGIQKGHMKMHLMNILNQLEASTAEKKLAVDYFETEKISHSAVTAYLQKLRN